MTRTPQANPPSASDDMLRFHFDTLGSTNDQARQLAKSHPKQKVRVSAATQTAARGSRRRAWASPRGGAWFSLALPMNSPQHATPIEVGEAVLEILATYTDGLTLRTPNDLLHHGKKLAGILCEQTLTPGDPRTTVIIGVGINVNFYPAELGHDLRTPPTSLREILGHDIDLDVLIESVTRAILNRLET